MVRKASVVTSQIQAPRITDNLFGITNWCDAEMSEDTLGGRIKAARLRAGIRSQQALADLVGVSRAAVTQWEGGGTISADSIFAVARACGVSAEWLKTGRNVRSMNSATLLHAIDAWDSGTPLGEDEVELPLFREVELAAGSGCTQVQENHGAKLRFAKSTLRRKGIDQSHAACCFVTGDSMEPVLPDGSTVGVDTANKQIVDGKMYAIDHGGLLRVKYLYRIPGGGIRIRSANRDHYPDEDLTPDQLEHFRVIGRVFWYSVLL